MATGWRPDIADLRDYAVSHPSVQSVLSIAPASKADNASSLDLREFFPPIDVQTTSDVSAAYACASLLEYFERRTAGSCERISTRFLWALSRRLQKNGPLGMRAVLKTIVRIGTPPMKHVPVDASDATLLSDPFLYSFSPRQTPVYFRLDERSCHRRSLVGRIRRMLQANFPVVVGFSVPDSITSGKFIPYRPMLDSIIDGQAAVIVGYDDQLVDSVVGAFLVRMSWGDRWGDGGYGWLPYRYLDEGLASDVWTIVREPWVLSGELFNPSDYDIRLASTLASTNQ